MKDEALARARNRTMQRFAALNERCPGCGRELGEHEGEYHHFPWREGHTADIRLKIRLYSIFNGVRTCHKCHMHEGIEFQQSCMALILMRVNGARNWWTLYGRRMVSLGMDPKALPEYWPVDRWAPGTG